MVTDTPNLGVGSDTTAGARGVFGGGFTGPSPANAETDVIQYINISSAGNAVDFGDLSATRRFVASLSSSTRGVFGGGFTTNTIEYITISSTGDAIDFGDLSVGKYNLGVCSSSTRGIFAGGFTPTPAFTYFNTIEYITISSTGDAVDFGDLSVGKSNLSACSSSTRGVFAGGFTPTPAATYLNVIEYINISSFGDAVDFGDLSVGKQYSSSCSSSTRGIFAGGYTLRPATTGFTNTIEYINISSFGDAVDFGDLSAPTRVLSACSNAHGGL